MWHISFLKNSLKNKVAEDKCSRLNKAMKKLKDIMLFDEAWYELPMSLEAKMLMVSYMARLPSLDKLERDAIILKLKAAVIVATKYSCEDPIYTSEFAWHFGCSTSILKKAELELLKELDFRLGFDESAFMRVLLATQNNDALSDFTQACHHVIRQAGHADFNCAYEQLKVPILKAIEAVEQNYQQSHLSMMWQESVVVDLRQAVDFYSDMDFCYRVKLVIETQLTLEKKQDVTPLVAYQEHPLLILVKRFFEVDYYERVSLNGFIETLESFIPGLKHKVFPYYSGMLTLSKMQVVVLDAICERLSRPELDPSLIDNPFMMFYDLGRQEGVRIDAANNKLEYK